MRAGLPNCDGFFRDGGILHYARQSGDYGGQRLSNKLNKLFFISRTDSVDNLNSLIILI